MERRTFSGWKTESAGQIIGTIKKVHLEEAWGILRNKGYQNQFEGDWMVLILIQL